MGEKTYGYVEKLRLFLFGAAVLALLLAAGRPTKADDKESSEKNGATAYLRIPLAAKPSSLRSPQNLQPEYEIYKNTQKQLLLSPLVLNAAVKKPAVGELAIIKGQKNAVDWLSQNLQITFPDNAEIMKISLSGGDRKERALLVNAVIDAYMSEVVEVERKRREERLNELRNIQLEKQQEIKGSRNELRNMAKSLGTSDSDTLNIRQKNTLDELRLLREEFLRRQFDVSRMNVELAGQKVVRDAIENTPLTDIECQMLCPNDVILKKLGELLVELQLSVEKTDEGKLQELQKKYAARLEQIRRELTLKRRAEIEIEIKKLEACIEMAQRQLEVTSEELKRLRKEADRIGLSSNDMEMRRATIGSVEKSLASLAAEIEALHIESRTAPTITILLKAEVPQ